MLICLPTVFPSLKGKILRREVKAECTHCGSTLKYNFLASLRRKRAKRKKQNTILLLRPTVREKALSMSCLLILFVFTELIALYQFLPCISSLVRFCTPSGLVALVIILFHLISSWKIYESVRLDTIYNFPVRELGFPNTD